MRACACSYTGVGLFYKMQTSHGHMTSGYGTTNHTFPLVFGETGSFYTSVRTHSKCHSLPHLRRLEPLEYEQVCRQNHAV